MSIGMRKGSAYCVTSVHMLTVVTSNVPQIALYYEYIWYFHKI